MDYIWYKAIRSGNIHQLHQILSDDNSSLSQMKTHLNNNSLHVAVQFNQEVCVREICKRWPSLLLEQNFEGNTPLHIGARLALTDIVEVLLNCARQMIQQNEEEDVEKGLGKKLLGKESTRNDATEEETEHSPSLSVTKLQQLVRIVNKKKDTALHEALQDGYRVANLLVAADPSYEYFANDAGETPLYLAARYGQPHLVQMLSGPSYNAPDGRTILHTTILYPRCPALTSTMLDVILKKMPQIVKEVDMDGLTALHYVAIDCRYIQDKDGMTALHHAATRIYDNHHSHLSNNDFIENLIQRCPDCWELADNEGRNFLHIAVKNKRSKVIKYVFDNKSNYMVNNLVRSNDNYGNTPLGLLILNGEEYYRCALTKECIDIFVYYTSVITTADSIRFHDEVTAGNTGHTRARNSLNDTREERSTKEEQEKKRRQKEIEKLEKLSQNHVLVATLIATVAFAAGFTLPGGYKNEGSNEGMATLAKKTSFIAFMVFNSLAMLLSTFAVFLNFWSNFISTSLSRGYDLISVVRPTLGFTFFAILAMVAAFISGTYTVLSHLPALAIPLCLLGCSFFLLCIRYLYNTYRCLDRDGHGYFIVSIISRLCAFDVFRPDTN
ncbi:hypothetical protein MKW92_026754 [Papaver armeniacum]|nr:hypothetical protein MKW92_026754 [Papaver armeniacum]